MKINTITDVSGKVRQTFGHKKLKKKIAMTTAVTMAAGSCLGLSACGKEKSDEDVIVNEEASQTEEKAMGRYLEEDVNVPEDCWSVETIKFLEDNTLRLIYSDQDGIDRYVDSSNNGETWGESVSISELLGLGENSSPSIPKIADNGGIFVTVTDYDITSDEQYDYTQRYIYITPEGEAKELPITDEMNNGFVNGSEFTDNNTLLLQKTGDGILEINLEDGSIKTTYDKGNYVTYFGLIGNRLITMSDDAVHYYDVDTGKPIDDEEALSQSIIENSQVGLGVGSYPIIFIDGDEEGTLFYVDSKGLYRYAFGGSVVEQIADGSLNSISSPNCQFAAFQKDAEGNFYLAANDYSNEDNCGEILKYVYDKDVPSVPDTELTVYSLTDNSYMRQVAAVFQKKYPNIYLNLETGITGEDAITTTDALKTLNTEIMAGKGPDIMMLDGIPADTYVEKGMLEDVSGILKKIEESDGILSNIKDAYTDEDGSVYQIPLRFSIPVIAGKREAVEKITDLKSMADTLEEHQEEYNADFWPAFSVVTPEVILQTMASVCTNAWIKEDGTLDEEAVSEYLEQVNRIYQVGKSPVEEWANNMGVDTRYYSETNERHSSISGSSTSLVDGRYLVAMGELDSPNALANLDTVKNADETLASSLWNGQAQNCFIPLQTVGISSKSADIEAAETFVEFLLSQEGQRIGKYDGLPVNEAVYDDISYWSKNPGEEIGVVSSSYGDSSSYVELIIKAPSKEVIQETQALGKSLTSPSKTDEIIRSAITSAGLRYLNDEISLEEAAKAAIQEVNLYLSE